MSDQSLEFKSVGQRVREAVEAREAKMPYDARKSRLEDFARTALEVKNAEKVLEALKRDMRVQLAMLMLESGYYEFPEAHEASGMRYVDWCMLVKSIYGVVV